MKRFKEFGIDPLAEKNMFPVQSISIEQAIGLEIEVLDFAANVRTEHGEGRYVLKVRSDELNGGKECKFFTTAENIRKSLDAIGKAGLPFLATIQMQRTGKWKTYYFT